jgi:UDP:flavonoid glycosyltransferase YjiC (YdhE family)
MGFDQPDNAARLERLGVGAALYPGKFTGANVAAKLQTLLRPEVRERCREVAAKMANHRGVERACEVIEDMPKLTAAPRGG